MHSRNKKRPTSFKALGRSTRQVAMDSEGVAKYEPESITSSTSFPISQFDTNTKSTWPHMPTQVSLPHRTSQNMRMCGGRTPVAEERGIIYCPISVGHATTVLVSSSSVSAQRIIIFNGRRKDTSNHFPTVTEEMASKFRSQSVLGSYLSAEKSMTQHHLFSFLQKKQ